MSYQAFLHRKTQIGGNSGFEPLFMPDFLFDFQKHLVEWALLKGKAAIIADCGLGKSPMELVWAENVRRKTNKPVLLISPLAVSNQMVRAAAKFGIEAKRSNDGTVHPNITCTNYERLHYFNPDDFSGVVCDESSILKNFTGQTKKDITRFMTKIHYRLLGTATAAPNDFVELGTSSEALGNLAYLDVLQRFFVDDKDQKGNDKAGASAYSQDRQARRVHGYWRLKGHSERHFWKWVCSWARACRKPSDLGFSDEQFALPPLIVQETMIENELPLPGEMFIWKAVSLADQRAELRATLRQRCETVAKLVEPHPVSIQWCDLNDEGDMLESMIPNSVQISGADSDEKKEEIIEWFLGGKCICNSHKFRCKLATCGNLNMQQIVAQNIRRTNPSDRDDASRAEPQRKTGSICEPTISPIQPSSNGHQRTTQSETPAEERNIEVAQNSGSDSAVSQKNGRREIQSNERANTSKNTASLLTNSNPCSQPKAEVAQFADSPIAPTSESSRTSTIATPAEPCAESYAPPAISDSESSGITQSFASGQECTCGHKSGVRRLISKAKIFGFGLNLQHCNHMTFFPSHSWEKYYQAVRRCWRFGQKSPVNVDIVTTQGEAGVLQNLQRKSAQDDKMFDNLVAEMNHSIQLDRLSKNTNTHSMPSWIN